MKTFRSYLLEASELDQMVVDLTKPEEVDNLPDGVKANFETKKGKDSSRKADSTSDETYKKLNLSRIYSSKKKLESEVSESEYETENRKQKVKRQRHEKKLERADVAESEDLQELSNETLSSYKKKSLDDIRADKKKFKRYLGYEKANSILHNKKRDGDDYNPKKSGKRESRYYITTTESEDLEEQYKDYTPSYKKKVDSLLSDISEIISSTGSTHNVSSWSLKDFVRRLEDARDSLNDSTWENLK